jgi:hypothetical protein
MKSLLIAIMAITLASACTKKAEETAPAAEAPAAAPATTEAAAPAAEATPAAAAEAPAAAPAEHK